MVNVLGIVEVRDATQLKTKVARKLGGKSLLEWVVRRVTDCQQLDGVIVLLPSSPQDECVRELLPSDVSVFIGPQPDPLARFTAAAEAQAAASVVRVCADSLFVDPVLIDRLVIAAGSHQGCDYASYRNATAGPAILSAMGLFAEWFPIEALRQANREAKNPADREHVTRYLYSHPEKFNVRLVPLPPELDRDDLRLKVRCEEDWEHAQLLYEALGPEECEWPRIAGLLDRQPAMRKRMAHLNRGEAAVG